MKDLFISMGSEIHVRNFPNGDFLCKKISAQEVGTLIKSVIDNRKKLIGCFDFGSVPSEKNSRDFQQLLNSFKIMTGVQLEKSIFAMQRDNEDDCVIPNFNFITTITDEMNMLAVEYYFSDSSDSKADVSDLLSRLVVSDSSMDFYLFQKTA